jgi:tetratricopeptide (TPR) repeat protein
LSFYRYNLKLSGKIQKAGWAFLSFAFLWIGLNAHSGYIRYHESAGARAFENIKIPDELALARTNPARWLSANDRQNLSAGKKHFYAAMNAGLFVNVPAVPKLAWIEYLSGNTEEAVRLLGVAAERQEGEGKALSFYYRGAILNRLEHYEQALASLDQALAERPDLIAALEERGESLWQLGRQQEAISAWNDAVKRNSSLPLANNLLGGAAAALGQTEAAGAYEKQADRFTPADPLFHWMLGLRLQNVSMHELAEKHFQRAVQLNPEFKRAR